MKIRRCLILLLVPILFLTACRNASPTPAGSDSLPAGSDPADTAPETPAPETETPETEDPTVYGQSGLKKGAVILFAGDSITDWYRADQSDPTSLGRSDNYVSQFNAYIQQHFPDDGLTIYNTGISGMTIEQMQKRQNKLILDLDPDYLILNIGTNNAWNKFNAETVEANYRKLVDDVIAGTHAQIILVQPYLCESDKLIFGEPLNDCIPAMNEIGDIICRIAAEKDLPVIFYGEIMRQAVEAGSAYVPTLSEDGIHPTELGFRMFFDTLCRELQLTDYEAEFSFDFTAIRDKYGIRPFRA